MRIRTSQNTWFAKYNFHGLRTIIFAFFPWGLRETICRTRLTAAGCGEIQTSLSFHLLPDALAAAGCGETAIYAPAAANRFNKNLNAYLALHMCVETRASNCIFSNRQLRSIRKLRCSTCVWRCTCELKCFLCFASFA